MAIGCVSYEDNVPGSVQEAVSFGGKTADPPPAHDEKDGESHDELLTYDDGSSWNCKITKVSMQDNPAEFVSMSPLDGVIYPGALLQGKSLSTVPQNIIAKRAGGSLTLTLVAGLGNGSQTRELPEVSLGKMTDEQNSILNDLNKTGAAVPANVAVTAEVFDSLDEFALRAKVSLNYALVKVKGSMDFSSSQRKSRIMVKLTQNYYTMFFSRKDLSVDSFFAPGNSPSDLAKQIGAGNPATYVSKVTYGRIAYIIVESDESKKALKAAIEASFRVGSASVETEFKKTVKNAKVSVVAFGGPSTAAYQAASASIAASTIQNNDSKPLAQAIVDALITDPNTAKFGIQNPPLPISYEVRNVLDDSIVANSLTSTYNKRECLPVMHAGELRLSLDGTKYKAGAPPSWPGSTDTVNQPSSISGLTKGSVGGLPTPRFGENNVTNSQASGINCGFALGAYSVAFVGRVTSTSNVNDEMRSLLSTRKVAGPGNWLQLGFKGKDLLYFGHGESDVAFSYTPNPNIANVVVVTSDNEGKNAWVDGSPILPTSQGIGDGKTALTQANGCTLGNPEGQRNTFIGDLGEIRAYVGVLSPAKRRTVECELGKKWSVAVKGCTDGVPTDKF